MHEKQARSILSPKNGMNLYRGCTHGCIYCDARSVCYQMQHEFEDIEVKVNAPQLLEQALRRKRRRCMIGTGAMSDPYVHAEKQLMLTRKCLELIDKYGFGLSIQTKSDLILRDLDLLKSIHRKAKCVVQMTLTTYDEKLCRMIEPNVCTTRRRTEVLQILKDEGIPTVCWMTPLLPFINDTEENIRGILNACIEAGVYGILFWNIGVTLRDGDRQYFYRKLDEHFPGLKEKYMEAYGDAYVVTSPNDRYLSGLVRNVCGEHGIVCDADQIFRYLSTYEDRQAGRQMTLWEV